MEYRPNSRPELTGPFIPGLVRDSDTNTRSADIGPNENRGYSPIQPLTEHFIMKRAINHWFPPKYPSYNLIDARLQSFKNWPESLCEGGFFYDSIFNFTKFWITVFSFKISFHLYQVFHYRLEWRNNLLPLWNRVTWLATFWQSVAGTCTLFTLMRVCALHQRHYFHSRK